MLRVKRACVTRQRKKKGGRRRTKPQLLIKPAATGRQMAGCTCASLTQLRLSCPFDDSLPGVASWASTGGEARRAAPLRLCITGGPRENTAALAAQALVAASQPASVLVLRAVSCPCQSRSRRWRKRKSPAAVIAMPTASKRLAWRETRRIRVKPRAALTCAFLSYQRQANAEFKQKVYRYRGFTARQVGATSKSSVCWKSLLSAVTPCVIIIHCASKI